MGIYTEYLDSNLNFEQLTVERKRQLLRIAELRARDVVAFAADINKAQAQITIDYSDLLPFTDQLSNLNGRAIDLILETPGGSGEVAEDLVKAMRGKYEEVGVIIPGYAKSAGTIIAMAGDEILMGPHSALGPIDAQMSFQGKRFSADAFLEGLKQIKQEVDETGSLNRAYIPILQGISPGEIQHARNALDFAKILVTDWLARYKFRTWDRHTSNQDVVTDDEKTCRANEIADMLCDHGKWKTHGRSIKITDLEEMRLRITDYSRDEELHDAIQRYYVLLQMTFATNIYKLFETPQSQIYRFIVPPVSSPQLTDRKGEDHPRSILFDMKCVKCGSIIPMQANLEPDLPLEPGRKAFPADNKLVCPNCGTDHNLGDARRQIEAQAKAHIQ